MSYLESGGTLTFHDGATLMDVQLRRAEGRWRWDVLVYRHGVYQYTEFGYTLLRLSALSRIDRVLAQVQRNSAPRLVVGAR